MKRYGFGKLYFLLFIVVTAGIITTCFAVTLGSCGFVRDDFYGVDGLDHAHSVAVSLDGKNLYIAGNHDDAIAVFDRDVNNGKLTFLEMQQKGFYSNGLDFTTSLAISPNNEHLYATGAVDGTLAEFRVLYTPAELDAERSRWDANDDNKIGLEEAIQALRITSGLN